MEYRRFGQTELDLSVISLGGMRFVNSGTLPRHRVSRQTLDQTVACVKSALDCGINCFETAFGYGNSEHAYGMALTEELNVSRKKYYVLTKSRPGNADDARRMVEKQLKALRVEKIDLYAWHGINTTAEKDSACAAGGPVEALLKLREQGVIGSVGFSGHGPAPLLLEVLGTGLFQFANLHYYYFDQSRKPVVDAAHARDMGVLIISPNDKGGRLFNPPELLRRETAPLTPIQWNARFCLSHPGVHTLAFGMTESSHFREMAGVFPAPAPMSEQDAKIKEKLDGRQALDPYAWFDGRGMENDPSDINIAEVLRQRKLWKCYDMDAFADYRYNMFHQGGSWLPGKFANRQNIQKINLANAPDGIPLQSMLGEFHRRFYRRRSFNFRGILRDILKKIGLLSLIKRLYRRYSS